MSLFPIAPVEHFSFLLSVIPGTLMLPFLIGVIAVGLVLLLGTLCLPWPRLIGEPVPN